jgi:hypothetical protein
MHGKRDPVMRRMLWFLHGPVQPAQELWSITPQQHRQLLELLSQIGLSIVEEARGPVPLLTFGRRVLDRLHAQNMSSVPLPHFADALKRVIRDMRHERLKVMSPTDFIAVGYVYNAQDPETWPVKGRL